MNWNAARPWLGTVARLVLGVVWIWAAWSKIRSPRTFTQAVRAYDATPEWLSRGIGYGLPILELALGVLLILGLVTRIAAAVSGVLFVVFLIGLIQASIRGIKLECGCFGGGGTTGGGGTEYTLDILRDLGLLVLAAYLVVWALTYFSLDGYIARNDIVEPPSAKRLRTDQGRRKYEAQLAVRRARAASRTRWLEGSLAGVIVLVVLIGIGVQSSRAKIEGSLTAKNATVANGVVFGKKAAATVDVYEDFQCPICLAFEQSVVTTLDKDVRANKAQVRFHTISILDRSSSGNRYSSRAANAALCASDISVEKFVAFHNVLYGKVGGKQVQPDEGENGRTNAQLSTYAKAAGITGAALTTFQGCVSNEDHKALVEALTERASRDGVNVTPTVKVNGKSIGHTLSAFNAAVAKALKTGPAPSPSVTPSPSPTSKAASPSPSPSASSTKSG
ncbi:MauE/DoxX family redox-associated membrane protein [uncultured Jatrophihabitans sp.]|uniref:MauE/DoxX family redox-associated membrane protein n=1 Tax=uncultured Jatrophihabitans sp. TaxID=1610747 RepID=UPI0035C9C82C